MRTTCFVFVVVLVAAATASEVVQNWKVPPAPAPELGSADIGRSDEETGTATTEQVDVNALNLTVPNITIVPIDNKTSVEEQAELKVIEAKEMETNECGNATVEYPTGTAQDMSNADWSEFEGPVVPPKIPTEQVEPTGRDCAQYDTCNTCLDIHSAGGFGGCGWCVETKTCMQGTAMGPSGSPTTFNCSTWDFVFCSGEPCSVYNSCYQCVLDPFCGWCGETNQCTEGTEAGPLFGSCDLWDPHSDVPGRQCSVVRHEFPSLVYRPEVVVPDPVVMEYPGV